MNAMKKTILVIDDVEQIRKLLNKILKGSGYRVVAASNGDEGLRILEETPIDLVITDMVMPEKMGMDVIMEIKEKYPQTKVIAISGGGDFGPELELDLARLLGVKTLQKPFTQEEILDLVKKLMTVEQPAPDPSAQNSHESENDKT